MNFKYNLLKVRIEWVKNDLKRTVFLALVPIIAVFFLFHKELRLLISINMKLDQQIIFGVTFGLFALIFCLLLQIFLFKNPNEKQEIKASLFFTGYLFFINALAEELFFRWFLLTVLLLLFNSPDIALFVSAIIFGYYHVPLFGWSKQKAFIAFLGGLFFGAIFLMTKSILVVWIAHGLADIGFFHESIIGYLLWKKTKIVKRVGY